MAEDYYNDGPENAEAPETESQESSETGEPQTANIPKELLGGREVKPGDVIELRIVSLAGDEVQVAAGEVESAEAETAEEEEPEQPGAQPEAVMPGMSGMME